jgi:hypothetical protein
LGGLERLHDQAFGRILSATAFNVSAPESRRNRPFLLKSRKAMNWDFMNDFKKNPCEKNLILIDQFKFNINIHEKIIPIIIKPK